MSRFAMRMVLVLVPSLLLLVGCGSQQDVDDHGLQSSADANEPSEKVKQKLGEHTLGLIDGATRVEVFRIDPFAEKRRISEEMPNEPGPRIDRWLITNEGDEQGKEFALRLAAVLKKDGTYFGQQAKCHDPGVAFRMWHEKESVEVIICFACDNLAVVTRDAAGKEVHRAFGAFGGSDPVQPQLIRLAKDAFPNDPAIQALDEVARSN